MNKLFKYKILYLNMFDLSNKKILIFGGTGELMGTIALGLNKQNAQVIIIGRDGNKAQKIIKDTNIDFFMFDILNDNLDILFQQIYKKYDNIDFLINGAGVNSATPLLSIQNEEINEIFEINFNFVVKCCQLYIRNTLDLNVKGKILNIGSVSGINPLSKVFMYSASKAALHNFSKNISREYGNRGILTNILVPGFFPAEQNKQILSKKRTEMIFSQTPMNRFGESNELIGMVSLLASDESSFINGSELVIDGGYCVTKI
tara:strand:- start:1786 stop:2565 length:780 start_codon:yes stop_codon:yes gene_type:complete